MDKKSISLSLEEYKEIRNFLIINNNFRECCSCDNYDCRSNTKLDCDSYCQECNTSLKQLPLIEKIEKKIKLFKIS